MHGKLTSVKPAALQKKRENRNAVALDSEQNPVQKEDVVKVNNFRCTQGLTKSQSSTALERGLNGLYYCTLKVIDGPHSGRQGQIRHLFRNFAFLHSRMMLDNGGIFVCKCRYEIYVVTLVRTCNFTLGI